MVFQKGYKPWNKGLTSQLDNRIAQIYEFRKGYHHTTQTKEKISTALKGRILSKTHTNNMRKGLIGRKASLNTRLKMSLAHLGKKYKPMSDEGKKNISLSQKGKTSYMKGKTHTKETKQKISNSKKGQSFPCSPEHRRKISLANIGKVISLEQRKKISSTLQGRKMLESIKNKIKFTWNLPGYIQFAKERRKKQIIPLNDSMIEVKIQDYLKQLGVSFFTHQYLSQIKHSYQCDIWIPAMNLIIECDGDYWHANPDKYKDVDLDERQRLQKEKDSIRTKELIEKGFKVLRLWESEIKVIEFSEFAEKIKNV